MKNDPVFFSIENHDLIRCYARGDELSVPAGVKRIHKNAFHDCRHVSTIRIPESVDSIDDGAFNECAALSAIRVSSKSTAFCSKDGVLFNRRQTALVCYPQNKSGDEYEIPENVWRIKAHAFFASRPETVTLPRKAALIESGAFRGSNVKKVRFGGSSQELRSIVIEQPGNETLRSAEWIDTRREGTTHIA